MPQREWKGNLLKEEVDTSEELNAFFDLLFIKKNGGKMPDIDKC